MAQQRGQRAFFLPLHEQRHEVIDLRHGHVAFIVAADQGLRMGREEGVTTSIREPTP
jgi:hypothetical protein